MRLENKTRNNIIAGQLEEARGLYARCKGLLGRQSLAADAALWIDHCNSIHTFFMNFPIDVVFVNRDLQVRAVYANVSPWRLIWPVLGARSVFEFAAGSIARTGVTVGDQLNVVH